MGRQPCCEDRGGLKKGPWSAEEDNKLLAFISAHGLTCWREVPKLAGLRRCGKSCRLRWINYLRPDLKRGMLAPHEEDIIIQLHASHGNKWSRIAAQLPGRTDNEIKNCWNTRIKKKLLGRGIDPITHKPLFGMPGVTAPPGSSQAQIAGVNAPPHLGHPSINSSAFHHYSRKSTHRLQERVHTSPNSVMSPQVTTSLSYTPTTTNHEDELSVDYSADLLSHDHSIDSNLQASEFASENMFQGAPHMRFKSSHDGKDGSQNAAYMLYACPAPIAQAVHNSSLNLQDALYLHNPPHMLHNAPHMHYPPHMLQSASSILPNTLCTSTQLGASHSVQQPNQFRATEASVQALQVKGGEGIPSTSISIKESNDGYDAGGLEVDVNKEKYECTTMPTYARNAPPSPSSRSIEYPQDGGKSQPSHESCEPKHGGVTSTSVSSTQGGQWSGMTPDVLVSEEGEVEPEPDSIMSALPFLHEPSQALGHHSAAAACNNTLNSMGQYWSSMDYLWGDPMSLTN